MAPTNRGLAAIRRRCRSTREASRSYRGADRRRRLGGRPVSFRLIARLDVKGPNLVKGVHMEGLRALGAPEAFAHRYYEHGIDELLYMDVVASLYGRNSLLD